MKLNKTLIVAALLSVSLSGSVCSRDLLDNQESQVVADLKVYGFMNNKTLSLSEESVALVLDPRFDPNRAARPAAAHAKLFLKGSIGKVIKLYQDLSSFYAVLQAGAGTDPLQVDVTTAGFNVANPPNDEMIEEAMTEIFKALDR